MQNDVTQVKNRIEWILPKDNMKRITLKEKDQLMVYVDLHQMKCKEASWLISNLIAVIQENFILRIIHGFNHGVQLKRMFLSNFNNKRIVYRSSPDNNPGITDFVIVK